MCLYADVFFVSVLTAGQRVVSGKLLDLLPVVNCPQVYEA